MTGGDRGQYEHHYGSDADVAYTIDTPVHLHKGI